MITVAVLINGQPIAARSAVNSGKVIDGETVYNVDDGSTVLHERADGAIDLAIKLLGTIKEMKR